MSCQLEILFQSDIYLGIFTNNKKVMIIGDNISQRKTQSIIPSLPGVTMTEFLLTIFS